jgi:hypothetical protein
MTEQNEQKYLDKMNRNTWKKTEMPGQKKNRNTWTKAEIFEQKRRYLDKEVFR